MPQTISGTTGYTVASTGGISAPVAQFATEFIKGYERGESMLRKTVSTKTQKQGSSHVFLITDSGAATAQTRGLDGNLIGRSMNQNQVTLTMTEWHDLPRKTGFNIFSSQYQGREDMYQTAYEVINRKVENQILDALATATTGPTATASSNAIKLLTDGVTIMSGNNVPVDDGEVYACVSHGFIQACLESDVFSNADYVSMMKWDDGVHSQKMMYKWNGINIFTNTGIPGHATSSETCFLYHKSAIGHAIDSESFNVTAGYNDENDYSWVRASAFSGAKLLQNGGVQKLKFVGNAATSVSVS